jgi:hypothetical protein
MIRAVTLNNNDGHGSPIPDLHERVERVTQTGLAEIDILCCQGVWHTTNDREDETRRLAKSLRMNYSCFAAASHPWNSKTEGKANGVRGLAILTGAEMWMLNSGSLQGVGESDGTKGFVQFALVRKNDMSILVLNSQFCASRKLQRLQLSALFSHPLLKERYGAVMLCTDRQILGSAKELQAIANRSDYTLYQNPAPSTSSHAEGQLWILVGKKQPVATVISCTWQTNLSLEFKLDRISWDRKQRPSYLPISQEEKCGGYRERRQAFAM